MAYRMPAEWEPHERTLIAWPCRPETWGPTLDRGRREFAAVANAIADFEPVTMICASAADEASARPMLSASVETFVAPMDGSWIRDNGPIYVTDGAGGRRARHFRFNGYGERHAARDRDARLGATVAAHLGDEVDLVDVVLEGGAIAVDGVGTLVAPKACVMHDQRNWYLDDDEAAARISDALAIDRFVWLEQGLVEDSQRDPERIYYGTDGHIDLFCAFVAPGRALLYAPPAEDVNAESLADARRRLIGAGIEVVDYPYQAAFDADDGHRYIAPYLNFYVCNGAVVIPVAGVDLDADADAVAAIATHFADRSAVPIEMRAGPMQGGGIHCLTQQVPALQ